MEWIADINGITWTLKDGSNKYVIKKVQEDIQKNQNAYILMHHKMEPIMIDEVKTFLADISYIKTDGSRTNRREDNDIIFNTLEKAQKIIKYLVFI